MKALASKKSPASSNARHSTPVVHAPMGINVRKQRAKIHQIVQSKLTIGQPNDKYEQEADSVADNVVSSQPVNSISSVTSTDFSSGASRQGGAVQQVPSDDNEEKDVQRQEDEEKDESVQAKLIQREVEKEEEPVQPKLIQREAEEEEKPVQAKLIQREAKEEEEPVQAKLIQREAEEEEESVQAKLIQRQAEEEEEPVQAKGASKSAKVTSQTVSQKSGGSPMRPDVRGVLETSMGADLSNVRVHEDSEAHSAASSIKAKAFTHKNDIWLGEGQSQSDLHLMAHETTHVVQQGGTSQQGADNVAVQRLEDTANSESEAPAVSPLEKAKALIAAQVAMQQAEVKVGKSKEQLGLEKQKKAEEDKGKESKEEAKKKAEQDLAGTEAKKEGGEEGDAGTEGKAEDGAGAEEGGKEKKGASKGKGPGADPAFKAVVDNARNESTAQKEHKPATDEADAAQQAAESPASELESKAQSNQVDTMETAETPAFDSAAFKAKLMERIEAMAPKTAEEADDFKGSSKVDDLKSGMTGEVETQKTASQAPMQEAAAASPDASGIEPKPVTPLEAPEPGPLPGDIHAEGAAPKSKTKKDVETPVQVKTQQISDTMEEGNLTKRQLEISNEPEFNKVVDGTKEAESQAETAPKEYRGFESGTIDTAKQEATVTAAASMAGMHESRTGMTGQLAASQTKTKSDDELAREKVASDIKAIYGQTKGEVDTVLNGLDEKVSKAFVEGAEAAKQVFEDYVDARMTAYKEERYGGWLGWAKWVADKVAGMPDEVNRFYAAGRKRYLQEMDAVIDRVVAIIGAALTEAKAKVAEGKSKIAEYVVSLPENLREVGQQAASDIQEKFDSLEQGIDEKQDQLINDLATKYNENLQAIDARIEELKAANAGLVDMVVGFVVGVIETIIKITEMLTSLLAKIAGVIGDIVADPIGFLENLIKGVKMGFDNFVGNIMKHLIGGLVKWLTGALGPMGITIPDDIFSLKGVFSLVLQVLGLTWDYFRIKAVKLLGEPVVKALETGFELFMIVKEKGLAGLWEYIKEQFSNLKEMVIEEIKSLIITQVITAGVKWIIGLLNPVGAFIKAAMAIYEIVKFFIERAAQIYEFVNSVVDSIADIVAGNLGGAAQKVETALANSIPLIIGFLASLLGISGLARKVQKVIGKVRKKIDKAIDKLIKKVKKSAGKLFRSGKVKGADNEKNKQLAARDVRSAMASGIKKSRLQLLLKQLKKKYSLKEARLDANDDVIITNSEPVKILGKETTQISVKESVKDGKKVIDKTTGAESKDGDIILGSFQSSVDAAKTIRGALRPYIDDTTFPDQSMDHVAERPAKVVAKFSGFKEGMSEESRNSTMTGKVGMLGRYEKQIQKGKDSDYQGGHLIAHQFGGPDTYRNLVPQSQGVNLSAYKKVENYVRKNLENMDPSGGVGVTMTVWPKYRGPLSFPASKVAHSLKAQLGTKTGKLQHTSVSERRKSEAEKDYQKGVSYEQTASALDVDRIIKIPARIASTLDVLVQLVGIKAPAELNKTEMEAAHESGAKVKVDPVIVPEGKSPAKAGGFKESGSATEKPKPFKDQTKFTVSES